MGAVPRIRQMLGHWLGLDAVASQAGADPAPPRVPAGGPDHHQCDAAQHGPWSVAWCTRAGRRHLLHGQPCEDSAALHFTPGTGVHCAVADGVSGGARGDVASAAAVAYAVRLHPAYPNPVSPVAVSPVAASPEAWAHLAAQADLGLQLGQADEVVRQALADQAPGRSGATTLAAAWLNPQGLGWVHRVGDCRVYHWRVQAGAAQLVQLEQAAPDQNFFELQEVPPPGVPPGNPARMIGNGRMGTPELRPVRLASGEGLLLCSDGLHGALSHEKLLACMALGLRRADGPLRFAQRLVRQARLAGGLDDIAVLVLAYQCHSNIELTS